MVGLTRYQDERFRAALQDCYDDDDSVSDIYGSYDNQYYRVLERDAVGDSPP